MSLFNEVFNLNKLKSQLNNLNIQFDTFVKKLQIGIILNMGIQFEEITLKLLNLGLDMLNIEIKTNPFFNSNQQVKYIGDKIQNISLQMENANSMYMHNFKIGMPMPNMMLINNNISDNIPKMNISFQTTKNNEPKTTMCLNYGTTIKELIEKYCKEKGLPLDNGRIGFIYVGNVINKNDLTSIESFFKNNTNPLIIVMDAR